jgi:hypothetical protein
LLPVVPIAPRAIACDQLSFFQAMVLVMVLFALALPTAIRLRVMKVIAE